MPVPFVDVVHISVQFSWNNELLDIRDWGEKKQIMTRCLQSSTYLMEVHTHYTVVGSENSFPLPQPHSTTHLPWVVLWHFNHLSRSHRMLKWFWRSPGWFDMKWAWLRKITYYRVLGFRIKLGGVGIYEKIGTTELWSSPRFIIYNKILTNPGFLKPCPWLNCAITHLPIREHFGQTRTPQAAFPNTPLQKTRPTGFFA